VTDPFGEPDAARAYLADWQGRIQQKAASTQAMSDQIGRLRVTAEDENGLAEVTIDAQGALLDVRLSERIRRYAPEAVSRAVMGAVRQARQEAAGRARQIVVETMGGDSAAGQAIADRLEQQLNGNGRG
jgi:DNA-binding protein YbaB